MNKEARLQLIKSRFEKKREEVEGGGDIPLTQEAVNETVNELDSFQEFHRHASKTHLTSDE
jgi:hypothetical protein